MYACPHHYNFGWFHSLWFCTITVENTSLSWLNSFRTNKLNLVTSKRKTDREQKESNDTNNTDNNCNSFIQNYMYNTI